MPTEKFVDYLPGQIPVILGAAVVTNPAPGTSESWTVIVPVGITIPAIGASVGELRAIIESEIVFVTVGTTTAGTQTWTVTRGQEGTTPVTHTNSTPLLLDLTAGSAANMEQLNPSTAQTGASSITGQSSALGFTAIGTTGAPNSARYFSATTGGAPTTGAWLQNDVVVDPTGKIWICTSSGSPGAWVQIGTGGSGTLSNEADAATYADFATAISTIGATPTALIVHGAMTLTTNVTVPSTVKLRFRGTGNLTINAGVTLTINGPVEAAHGSQLFTLVNAATSIVKLASATNPDLWVEWFGAKGDATLTQGSGTDSTVPIQAAINAVQDYGGTTINFAGGAYRVTATVNLLISANRWSMRLKGQSGKLGRGRTWLLWDSASSTTPLLALYTRESEIDGFWFGPCNGRALLCGLDIDKDPGSATAVTKNRVKDCTFSANFGAGGAPSTGTLTYGVRIANVAVSNCDQMEFNGCDFETATGAGVYVAGTNWQSKEHWFIGCEFSGMPYGINVFTGSVNTDNCHFYNQTTAAIHNQNTFDPQTFSNTDSEGCPQFLSNVGPTAPVAFYGGRYALDAVTVTPSNGFEYINTSGPLLLSGVYLDNTTNTHLRIASAIGITAINCQFAYHAPFISNALGTLCVVSCTSTDTGQMDDQWAVFNGGTMALAVTRPLKINAPALIPQIFSALPPLPPAMHYNGTGGTLVAVTYYYYRVSFVTALGESFASTAVFNQSPAGANTISTVLSALSTGPPGTTARHIWRSTDNTNYYLIATIADNTTTTYTDTGTAGTLTALPASDTSGILGFLLGNLQPSAVKATSASAGTNGAVPAQVDGYITISVGGILKKIPYFNN